MWPDYWVFMMCRPLQGPCMPINPPHSHLTCLEKAKLTSLPPMVRCMRKLRHRSVKGLAWDCAVGWWYVSDHIAAKFASLQRFWLERQPEGCFHEAWGSRATGSRCLAEAKVVPSHWSLLVDPLWSTLVGLALSRDWLMQISWWRAPHYFFLDAPLRQVIPYFLLGCLSRVIGLRGTNWHQEVIWKSVGREEQAKATHDALFYMVVHLLPCPVHSSFCERF